MLLYVDNLTQFAVFGNTQSGAGTGSRVTGSPGKWLCPGRVGSRVKVIYLQTRYRDPVADRTTEWYSMVNTWTHCVKSRLN